MTAALEGGEWSAARPGRSLPPGKTRYPLYRRLGGPEGRSGRAENLAPPGFNSRAFQPVVSRYTDWATGATVSWFVLTVKWRLKRGISSKFCVLYPSDNSPFSVQIFFLVPPPYFHLPLFCVIRLIIQAMFYITQNNGLNSTYMYFNLHDFE